MIAQSRGLDEERPRSEGDQDRADIPPRDHHFRSQYLQQGYRLAPDFFLQVQQNSWAAFAQAAFDIAPNLELSGALRYDHDHEVDSNEAPVLDPTGIGGFWLDLTFTPLVMLIVGGMGSLTGAVGGTLVVTGVLEFVRQIERGRDLFGIDLRFPAGSQQYALSILILLVLILMPRGLFGWRELRCRSPGRASESPFSP